MKSTLVSIIIPAFNIEEYIGRCLNSCLSQTYYNIEIIVVNDGSTDKTKDIIEDYLTQDPRIISINKQNEGVNLARKIGVENAKGEYIFFLDGDDVITSNAIEMLIVSANENNADIIAGNVEIRTSKGPKSKRNYDEFRKGTGEKFLEHILIKRLHYIWGKLIRRSLFTNNQLIIKKEIVVGEDQILLYQLCMYAKTVCCVDFVVYYYILNETSVTQKVTDKKTASIRQELYALSLFELMKIYNYNDIIRQHINLRIIEASNFVIGNSGTFSNNNKKLWKIYRLAIYNSIFTRNTLLLNYTKVMIKAILSLFLPKTFYWIKR